MSPDVLLRPVMVTPARTTPLNDVQDDAVLHTRVSDTDARPASVGVVTVPPQRPIVRAPHSFSRGGLEKELERGGGT